MTADVASFDNFGTTLHPSAATALFKSAEVRQDVIRQELSAIVAGAPGSGSKAGLRGKVRKLIARELESAMAKSFSSSQRQEPSKFVLECMSMQAVRAAKGARPVSSWHCSSKGLAHSASTPAAAMSSSTLPPISWPKHEEFTRKKMSRRNWNGNFLTDSPDWAYDTSTAPVMPSKHREMSKNMWASINNEYLQYPEVSDASSLLTWPKVREPVTRLFMNPKDEFVHYREAKFQVGNKMTMRKG